MVMSANQLSSPEEHSALDSLLKLQEGIELSEGVGIDLEHFLYERYVNDSRHWMRKVYYVAKPYLPRQLQLIVRKKYAAVQANDKFPAWPIERTLVDAVRSYVKQVLEHAGVNEVYRISPWPERKQFAFAITHDVEWDAGLRNAWRLAEIENELGFRSSWNIVPERYPIDWKIVEQLRSGGFEIGIHGLKHDGRLFESRKVFEGRRKKIQQYAKDWGAVGIRSPSTLRKAEWMSELELEYDSSFPDTDPYEPQAGGCCSIWPFFIGNLVELPITMPQDHTLFEILGHNDISIWKEKADWIERNGGLVLVNVHPDYMVSDERLRLYKNLLIHMTEKSNMYQALPRDIAAWWRDRNSSRLRKNDGEYVVAGSVSARSSIIKTTIENGTLNDTFVD